MEIKPHSHPWYHRLSQLQTGYYYPWKSSLAEGNGEDAYHELLEKHLAKDKDVLDVGCGHGEFTLSLADRCRSILAYDRIPAYIDLAREQAENSGIKNVTFLCHDSKSGELPSIPAEDDAFDLLISCRGPLHWIPDARRVARPGARLIQLNPMETLPPPWVDLLPEVLQTQAQIDYRFRMRENIEYQLDLGGLQLHSCWTFDVPEYFDDPEQLYLRLAWGYTMEEVPSFRDVRDIFEQIYAQYADALGVQMRHRRFLWMALVDK